jgi:FemAB-related protein (PEP-CTERM system-associated)
MNAPAAISGVAVRVADLGDPATIARIDAFVHDHPDSTLFHRPHWSLIALSGCGQRPVYLVAERAGCLVGLLPLTHVRSLLFGNALVSVGFATGGGIVADTPDIAERLAATAWQMAQGLGLASVELRGGPVPEGWVASSGTYSSFSRPLPDSEKAVLGSIPRKQRAEVRRAQSFGLEVSRGRDEGHRRGFYRAFAEGVRNLGTPVFPRSLFDSALDLFGDNAEILLVSRDGEPVATQLIFYFKQVCMSYWGGGTLQARALRGNDLVWFEAMREAVSRGCTIADFGRSKPGTGPFERKRIWGMEERPIVHAVRTAPGRDARQINPLNPRYRLQVEAWQKLPLAIANRVGPLISRGLG